jgi:hypothetical protein
MHAESRTHELIVHREMCSITFRKTIPNDIGEAPGWIDSWNSTVSTLHLADEQVI